MSEKTHFEKTVLLSIGHLAVVVAGFLIPVFLSRWLSIEEYGTYKQLMMVYVFLMAVGHLGMDNGLFYFVMNRPEKSSVFSLNVMAFDAVIGLIVALALTLLRQPLADLFHNPELARYLPWMALYALLSLPTQHFEHYLAVLNKIREAMWLGISYETVKALVLVGSFYFFNSLLVALIGLNLLALVKILWLLRFNLRERRESASGSEWREQIRFGLPQGMTNLISAVLKFDKFVISSLFSVRQFTLYAVGCFEVPLIGSVSNTMTDLMSFEMVEANRREDSARVRELWHSTIRKVTLFQAPIALFLFFFAEPTITFIFSDTYRESARYFQVFTFILLLTGFSPEILFRVYARTGTLLRLQAVAAVFSIAVVLISAYRWGPMGALVGKLVADSVTLGFYSMRAGYLMGLSLREYLPWGEIARIFGLSAAAGFISYLAFGKMPSPPLVVLASGGLLYGFILAATCLATGVIKKDETEYLLAKAKKLIAPSLRGAKRRSNLS